MTPDPCDLCGRIAAHRAGTNTHVIHEFPHSLWVVGDHQFHRGYTLLLLNEHVKDLHELESSVATAYFEEVMIAARAVVRVYQPWKMNYSNYGNLVAHLHWHLFPRYAKDPERTALPWLHADQFDAARISADEARAIAEALRGGL